MDTISILDGMAVVVGLLGFHVAWHGGVAFLNLEQAETFLSLERLGQVLDERLECAIEGNMIERRENEEKDHHHEWTNGARGVEASGKETKQADLSDVETDKQVLQGTWVDGTAGVDTGVVDVKEVVSVGEVEEEDTDGGEDEDEWRNAGVAGSWNESARLLRSLSCEDLPMTRKLVMIGKTWPQPTPAILFHLKKILRGVEPSSLTRRGVTTSPARPTSMLAKTPRPCSTM